MDLLTHYCNCIWVINAFETSEIK